MPNIDPFSPRGMFHEGWTAEVNDYAIACGWALKGKQFIVGDVAGGLFAFEGDTGKIIWKRDFGTMATKHGHGEGSSPALKCNTLIINWDHEKQSAIYALNKLTGCLLYTSPSPRDPM